MDSVDTAGQGEKDRATEIPTLDEKVTYEVYAAAVKDAIKSTDEASAATVTAALSIATAYGALIALVTPTSRPTALVLALPILAFVLAALVALWGRSAVMKKAANYQVTTITDLVDGFMSAKRWYLRGAVALLAVAVVATTWIVITNYRPATKTSTTPTTIHVIIED